MNFISLSGALTVIPPVALLVNNTNAGQGDTGYIKGIVTENKAPVSRRVMCYHRLSGELVNSVWSKSDGGYYIDGLIAGVTYFVTSVDESGDGVQYNAVTQDLVTASEVTT